MRERGGGLNGMTLFGTGQEQSGRCVGVGVCVEGGGSVCMCVYSCVVCCIGHHTTTSV